MANFPGQTYFPPNQLFYTYSQCIEYQGTTLTIDSIMHYSSIKIDGSPKKAAAGFLLDLLKYKSGESPKLFYSIIDNGTFRLCGIIIVDNDLNITPIGKVAGFYEFKRVYDEIKKLLVFI